MKELLKIDDLSKSFVMHRVERRILGCQHINLSLMQGEFVGITGRSGSGKSTILRCIYRTNLPESGAIWYDSESFGALDLCQASERQMIYLRKYEMGYVSQFLNALPRQTAYDIVLKSALETFGADVKAARSAKHLSRKTLAEIVNIDSRYLANIENDATIPSLPVIIQLIKVCGLPVERYFNPEIMREESAQRQRISHKLKLCPEQYLTVIEGALDGALKTEKSADETEGV